VTESQKCQAVSTERFPRSLARFVVRIGKKSIEKKIARPLIVRSRHHPSVRVSSRSVEGALHVSTA
jgi:hypothetical protein